MFNSINMSSANFHGLTSELLDFASVQGSTPSNLAHHLAFFGASLGRYPHVFWRNELYPNLNIALVGGSGCGKGESLRIISKVYDFLPDQQEILAPTRNTTLTSGKHFLVMLHDILTRSSDGENRFLLIDEECSTQIKGASMWNGSLAETLCKVSDGVAISELKGSLAVDLQPVHYTSVGHITPMALLQNLRRETFFNGYANRILWIGVPTQEFTDSDGSYNEQSLLELRTKVAQSLRTGGEREHVTILPDTKERFVSYARELRTAAQSNEKLAALTQRLPQMCLKIALILALVNQDSAIDVRTLDEAIAVLDYSRGTIEELFGQHSQETPDQYVQRYLAHHGPTRRTDLMLALGRRLNRPIIEDALTRLIDTGIIIRTIRTVARGRRPEFFELNVSRA